MPYIDTNSRTRYHAVVANASEALCRDEITGYRIGDINYLFTDILRSILTFRPESYANYNEIIGVLECIKQEYYRKAVAKYEDGKCREHGEVFT